MGHSWIKGPVHDALWNKATMTEALYRPLSDECVACVFSSSESERQLTQLNSMAKTARNNSATRAPVLRRCTSESPSTQSIPRPGPISDDVRGHLNAASSVRLNRDYAPRVRFVCPLITAGTWRERRRFRVMAQFAVRSVFLTRPIAVRWSETYFKEGDSTCRTSMLL